MEIWARVRGNPRYLISSEGRLKRSKTGEIKKVFINKPTGYYRTPLYSDGGVKKNHTIHRLVAEAFVPNPDFKQQVNHINGNRTDNRAENLEWVSSSENVRHGFIKNGRISNRKGQPGKSKFRGIPVTGVCQETGKERRYNSDTDATKDGFSVRQIRRCGSGKMKTHGNHAWNYDQEKKETDHAI